MSTLQHEIQQLAPQPTAEPVRVRQRLLPRAAGTAALWATGPHQCRGPRLPQEFMVWFVITWAFFGTDR